MRWYLPAAVVFGLSITDVASLAEGPPADAGLARGRSTPSASSYQDAGYFNHSGLVRFQMVQGRLCLDPPRHRKGSQSRDADEVYESITVTAQRGIPSLHYICQVPQHHITLSVARATHVRIESYCPTTGERSVLDQPAGGPIRMTTSRGEHSSDHRGATLLHLRSIAPESFDRHHGRLIERLLRGQSLDQLGAATASSLLRFAADSRSPSAEEIRQSIDRLRSPRRTQRINAERQLIAWGTPIVPIVQSIDPDLLDAEQADRLAEIRRRLRAQVNDTPASLAMLLINDQQYWSLLAPQLSADQLQLANQHLSRCGLETLLAADSPDERIASVRE